MSIVPAHGSGPGHAGKSGSPSSRSMTLTVGPSVRQPAGAGSPARRAVRTGSALEITARAAISSPLPASTTDEPLTRSTSASVRISAPAARAALASARVTAPMPPSANPHAPGGSVASPRSW